MAISNQKGISFADQYPELLKMWDYAQTPFQPQEVSPHSHKKAWWKCENGHSWQAEIAKITSGQQCPFCANKRVHEGFNDLYTSFPELVKEWDYIKNHISPKEVTVKSHKKVWWLCERGHSWQAAFYSRTAGRGCPYCRAYNHSSFPEKAIYYYVCLYFPDSIPNYKHPLLYGTELDIFIPSLKIAIEYDGAFWHSNAQHDLEKTESCRKNGILLIRIREEGCPSLDDNGAVVISVQKNHYLELEQAVSRVFNEIEKHTGIHVRFDICLERDYDKILALITHMQRQNSVLNQAKFANEWNYIRNSGVSPDSIAANSNHLIWWTCEKGHDYQMSPSQRMTGANCPICAGRRVLAGINDLESQYPNISQEWHYKKNTQKPNEVYAKTKKRVWWICQQGHEWQTSVCNRTVHMSNCPVCGEKRIMKGVNDLETVAPEFLLLWNYEKNTFLPSQVGRGSHVRVWLKCSLGHEWQGSICDEIKRKGCPVCSGKVLVSGTNDLLSRFPSLKEEWNYQKNSVDPRQIGISSKYKAWWVCSTCGHEWQAFVSNRTHHSSGCPKCSRKRK